ncbi:MAG TPA: NADH-quinone oxidoreductase subunit H [Candidatus Saccharimonadales bacterium]|nr:NADH-quinone oxidoreductase subunit H [Candidatus Saccharimonadales bacterium]
MLLQQLAQVAFILVAAPLFPGVIDRAKHIVQSKRGPSVFQRYRDLWKLLQKGTIVPENSSWLFRLAPYLAFITPMIVATLIPVLTSYPLPYAFMGDMLAGGFFLALGSFFASVAALDTGSAFGGMGSSRARVVSLLAEPTVIMLLFGVTLLAQSTIPFDVNARLAEPDVLISGPHLLLAAALLMVILAEAGRIPVDNPSSAFELSMIDHSRNIEYSGRLLALMEWGGQMRFFVLLTILLNVLTVPWGLVPATGGTPLSFLAAAAALIGKVLVVCAAIVVIESTVAKWRFFRIPEYLGASFLLAALATITAYLTGLGGPTA